MNVRRAGFSVAVVVPFLAVACGPKAAPSPAAPVARGAAIQQLGPNEGAVSIVAWAGYIERGQTDPKFDWVTGFEEKEGLLSGVIVSHAGQPVATLPCDAVLVFFGLSPRLGPIANWGLNIERKQILVDTEKFETNVPGIFAVGDINTYPGKKKLILSGFHECALAAFGAAKYVFPDKRIALQYTTTSPKLHKVLGVETPVFD